MKEKINIAELLRNCPNGMELDCTMYDNVSFDKVSEDRKSVYPILCYITDEKGNRSGISFTENGHTSKRYGAKCVIFPKGKTTWEGFQRPFKDGDIIYVKAKGSYSPGFISIYKKEDSRLFYDYCSVGLDRKYFYFNNPHGLIQKEVIGISRLATEEEKQKLFNAIKKNGYKWNPETKTLEKLKYINDKMKTTIQWDEYYHGVHILTSTGTSLIVNARPSLVMNWYDAVRFFKDEKNEMWSLPTKEDLMLIYNNLKEINTLMKGNGGYEIDGTFWTADSINEYFAYNFSMNDERLEKVNKYCPHSVRGVNVIRR